MRSRFSAVFLLTSFFATSAFTQSKSSGEWAKLAELPNLTGVWELTRGTGRPTTPQPISFTPKYLGMQKAFQENPPQDNPSANCVPPGMPQIMGQPYPVEFLLTPGKVTILIEAYMQIRHIYTDGRQHPEDPDLTYNGHSIGRWENGTLVVDSVGFTADTPLGGNMGMRHSDKMHIVERIGLKDPNTLEIVTTVDDKEALTAPFARTATFARHADWTMAEYICQQNNRNGLSDDGKAKINLAR